MHPSRSRRRMALAAGLAAGLALATLPAAHADLLGGGSDAIEEVFAPQLVTVTADLAERNLLAGSGLDVTEHAGHDYVEVVLHTPADLALLESYGLPFEVRIPDLLARTAEVQRLNAAYAASVDHSPLPSGRDDYRTLADYDADLRTLASDHPGVVRLFKLPHQSVEGKDILGVEIASGLAPGPSDEVEVIEAPTDERPTFVLMGLHHAREWPSGEHAIEFAFDLAQGYGTDDRITGLVDRVRTVIIPVVNPDGFQKSVDDGKVLDLNQLNDQDPLEGTTAILATPNNAYKRKNCRLHEVLDTTPIYCDAAKSPGGYGIGVDLNRNYGAFHGGPGTDTNPASPIYHGGEGFSEPETQNIRELVSERHVTMLISNHTFSNLILRPNGVNPQTPGPDDLPVGDAPDEDALRDVGAAMAAQNGYRNIHGWELYDTTGTTEDYSYNATGGFGYTFEIGPDEFHPPFPEVVDEYLGTGDYHGDDFAGAGNREAYLIAMEAALASATHSIIAGDAHPGTTLRLTRQGSMPTWDPEVTFTDTVETSLTVPASGRFEWHVNPSTRPIVMSNRYQVLAETPTDEMTDSRPVPAPQGSVDIPWAVTQSGGLANVDLDWELPDDLDLEVYRTAADGSLEPEPVASSGNFVGDKERATFVPQAGEYVIRVINYAAAPGQTFEVEARTYDTTQVTTEGLIEAWTLTCERDGAVEQVPVIVDRGQRVLVDLDVCGPAGRPAPAKGAGRVR